MALRLAAVGKHWARGWPWAARWKPWLWARKWAAAATEAGARGAVKVYSVDDASRSLMDIDLYVADLKAAIARSGADVVLAAHTGNGRDLMAAAAFDLGAGLIADCLEVRAPAGRLVGVRPVYSGNILVDVSVAGSLQFATLRPRAAAPAPDQGAAAEIVSLAPAAAAGRVAVQKVERAETGEISLTDANIIVSAAAGWPKTPNWASN